MVLGRKLTMDIKRNSHYFYRIVFTFLIFLGHSGFVSIDTKSLYIGVDYFFIISGFFLTRTAEEHGYSVLNYTVRRIKKFWPHQILSFILLLILASLGQHSLSYFIKKMILHYNEYIPGAYYVTDYSVANELSYNFPVWYLSVLVLMGGVV